MEKFGFDNRLLDDSFDPKYMFTEDIDCASVLSGHYNLTSTDSFVNDTHLGTNYDDDIFLTDKAKFKSEPTLAQLNLTEDLFDSLIDLQRTTGSIRSDSTTESSQVNLDHKVSDTNISAKTANNSTASSNFTTPSSNSSTLNGSIVPGAISSADTSDSSPVGDNADTRVANSHDGLHQNPLYAQQNQNTAFNTTEDAFAGYSDSYQLNSMVGDNMNESINDIPESDTESKSTCMDLADCYSPATDDYGKSAAEESETELENNVDEEDLSNSSHSNQSHYLYPTQQTRSSLQFLSVPISNYRHHELNHSPHPQISRARIISSSTRPNSINTANQEVFCQDQPTQSSSVESQSTDIEAEREQERDKEQEQEQEDEVLVLPDIKPKFDRIANTKCSSASNASTTSLVSLASLTAPPSNIPAAADQETRRSNRIRNSSMSTDCSFSSHDEGFASQLDDSENDDGMTSDDESFYGDYDAKDLIGATTSDDIENKWSLSVGRTRKTGSQRYFWQYNVQSKGPKGTRIVTVPDRCSDPHVLTEAKDPVFSPDCHIEGVKHAGKARRGDGNDLTPNPRKLLMIGLELKKLSKIITDLTPVAQVPVNSRNKSRKEKNKLASRACRLKKKAQHEANKIKLFGLQQEHKKMMSVLSEIKQISKDVVNRKRSFQNLQSIYTDTLHTKGPSVKVAGSTAEFVNRILDNVSAGIADGGLDKI